MNIKQNCYTVIIHMSEHAFSEIESGINKGKHNRNFHQRTYDSRKRGTGVYPENSYRHRYGKFKVIAGGGKSKGGRHLIL